MNQASGSNELGTRGKEWMRFLGPILPLGRHGPRTA